MDDAAIHRISRETIRLVCSLTGSQWIATGLRPRDDKVSPRINLLKLGCELTPGLRLPGMALLGFRPFGPGPPRSAFLSTSAVILPSLAHCCLKPTRKPMWCAIARGVAVRWPNAGSCLYGSKTRPE